MSHTKQALISYADIEEFANQYVICVQIDDRHEEYMENVLKGHTISYRSTVCVIVRPSYGTKPDTFYLVDVYTRKIVLELSLQDLIRCAFDECVL